MVVSKDISVVIQGPIVYKRTQALINSVKKYYPDAEIVVSTWENSETDLLRGYDELMVNKDPGWAYFDKNNMKKYNVNRMLLSSQIGIEKASRKYVLKCRSDFVLKNNNLCKYVDAFKRRNPAFTITKQKIIVGSLFTLKYETYNRRKQRRPLHVSDFFCFGLKEDVRLFYDVPLVELEVFSRYFENNPTEIQDEIVTYRDRLWRFPPEQYLTLHFAERKFKDIKFEDCLHCNEVSDEFSEQVIVNNFIILDPRQSGLFSGKFPYNIYSRLCLCSETIWSGMYRNYVYQCDYKKYCDENHKVGLDIERCLRLLCVPYHFLKKVVRRFI